ncbi:MAG: efflux RND transporter periplasmic adaptor subunit [Kiritimatiellae bacterium]|nr:efflux RND transporter periplasmic adaptor subunit [Kiritimatiellia bacterium]
MSTPTTTPKNILGRTIGILLLAAAVAGIVFYHSKPEETPPDTSVRPLKSLVVGEAIRRPVLRFPGTLDADTGVDLSFEVGGRIVEFPLVRGQQVEKGDVLAKLDDSDFKNQVKDAQAQLDLAESTFARTKKALEINAVSQEDYSQAKANRDAAKAHLAIAKKSLDDTVLRAKFSGTVSDTYVDNFQTVAAGTRILKLQDISVLNLDVQIPETYLTRASRVSTERPDSVVTTVEFDSLPGERFPVELKEYSTSADPVTQTFRATFTMPHPEDDTIVLLPGMTGTLTVEITEDAPMPEAPAAGLVQIPSDAVGTASDASFFVWLMTPAEGEDGIWTVAKRTITIGERTGDLVNVTSGLAAGDRIAAAGITILTEGRRVTLYSDPAPQGADPAAAAAEDAADKN